MTYEEKRVVSDPVEPAVAPVEPAVAPVEPVAAVETAPVRAAPETVVRQPVTRTVVSDDPVGNAYAASQLIQTIVWAVVVLVLLGVALLALHVYAHLF